MNHEFAIFCPEEINLGQIKTEQLITIDHDELYQRLARILRIKTHDTVLLFNQKITICIRITNIDKKQIQAQIVEKKYNIKYQPSITFLLPLLKQSALEEAVYSLVEIGINTIQLMITQKAHRSSLSPKEKGRLHNIVIAAAEQSKNFAFPTIQEPLTIEQIISGISGTKLFFDPAGQSLADFWRHNQQLHESLTLCIGPEGDLTEQEKKILRENNFTFMSLTPTILRAQQAAALAAGIIRTLYKQDKNI